MEALPPPPYLHPVAGAAALVHVALLAPVGGVVVAVSFSAAVSAVEIVIVSVVVTAEKASASGPVYAP